MIHSLLRKICSVTLVALLGLSSIVIFSPAASALEIKHGDACYASYPQGSGSFEGGWKVKNTNPPLCKRNKPFPQNYTKDMNDGDSCKVKNGNKIYTQDQKFYAGFPTKCEYTGNLPT